MARGQGPDADAALAGAGFLRLRVWADGGQRFHLAHDEMTGDWIHLHVVDRLAFGDHAGLELATAGDAVLERRRRFDDVWVLDPDDELWVTLLHALLDKGGVKRSHRQRLVSIAGEAALGSPVAAAWAEEGGGEPSTLLAGVRTDDWDAVEARAAAVAAAWRVADPVAGDRSRAHRRELQRRKAVEPITMRGLAVALLAPDGAGKSTIARRVADEYFLDARVLYLGLYGAANPVVDLPLPGAGAAQRLTRTWFRWLQARYHQGRRRLVVFDRHPYDARLGGSNATGDGRAARLRRAVLGRALPPPDLVVVLDAPGQVLFDRKGEHDPDTLEAQRQAYLRLADRLGARAEVVDATADENTVVRAVTAVIWRRQLARQAGRRG